MLPCRMARRDVGQRQGSVLSHLDRQAGSRPARGGAVQGAVAVVPAGHLPRDRQPQPESGVVPHARTAVAGKAVEHGLGVGHPRSGVIDLEHRLTTDMADAQHHRPSRRVPRRVAQQVPERKLHQRGIGLGKDLVNRALDYARDSGCSNIFLQTTDGLPESQQLYEKLGFEVTSNVREELWDGVRPLIQMELGLK